ncbi:MAG: HlyD family efflux transporter periplasmic adaptor subunit [Blastochloris viridis]|uniref:HlyD family efflux transporter periplasmic adaptor subunit n=1 Tax=Blastochloris viridis TaxID=1079 RepID=A0A6N4RAH8_BLAVI|nr:MAG: HlyD family efflux transporter periplasmic adaptor subunit [Blastochloris viridis]
MKPSMIILLVTLGLAGVAAYTLLPAGASGMADISPAAGPKEAGAAEDHGHEGGEENHAKEESGSGEADGHGHGGEEEHGEEGSTKIAPEAAKSAGIVVEKAGPANLGERLPLRGKIILNPETTAEVKARFPGVVKSVRVTIGQSVAKGATLATVESNDSLQTYAVTSPLAGVVLARSTNVGDTAADQSMFTVANLHSVTAELHVFPQDLSRVQVGQEVYVESVDGTVEGAGTVKSLLPTTDADTQTVQVWVTLDNEDNRWRSGMAVQGGAVIGKAEVPLAVKTTAIQTMEDKPAVFVQNDDTYETHPVKLGRSDGVYTEVLEGLAVGDIYVSKNSFIVKADIGKAGAGHEH